MKKNILTRQPKRSAAAGRVSQLVVQRRAAESPWLGRSRASDQSFEERRLAVLQKAADMFSRRGYHETSFDNLAAVLNVTKPTIYYYVRSKPDCLAEIARMAQEGIMHALRHARTMDGTGLERLVFVFRRYIEHMTSDFGRCIGLARQSLTDNAHAELLKRIEWGDKQFLAIFDEAIADGSIQVIERRVDYEIVIGSLNWLGQWYHRDGQLSEQRLSECHIASLVRLLTGHVKKD